MRLRRRLEWILLTPLGVLVLVVIVLPGTVLAWYSLFDFILFRPVGGITFVNYYDVLTDPLYRRLALNTVLFAIPVAVLSSIGGFVIAYAVVFGSRRWRGLLLALILTAVMASYLARIYSWRILLGENGVINTALEYIGLIDEPLGILLYSRFAAILAETNFFIPLAALTYFAALAGLPGDIRAASRDLGAGPGQTFARVILPLTGPASLATILLVFFVASGDYVTPVIVGGPSGQTLGVAIAASFGQASDFGLGGALALVVAVFFGLAYMGVRRLFSAIGLLPRESKR